MACEAKTYSDGSWVCWACDVGGDAGEDPEDFCPKRNAHEPPSELENAETVRKPS